MKCFLLQKCLDKLDDDNANDINVQVSCACCGGIVKESNVELEDDNETKNGRGEVERDLLRSKSSRLTRFNSRFSISRKSNAEKDPTMAKETVNVHSPSTSTKDLSQS